MFGCVSKIALFIFVRKVASRHTNLWLTEVLIRCQLDKLRSWLYFNLGQLSLILTAQYARLRAPVLLRMTGVLAQLESSLSLTHWKLIELKSISWRWFFAANHLSSILWSLLLIKTRICQFISLEVFTSLFYAWKCGGMYFLGCDCVISSNHNLSVVIAWIVAPCPATSTSWEINKQNTGNSCQICGVENYMYIHWAG